jgi:deoxyadenosine/deoxycytidine kinase
MSAHCFETEISFLLQHYHEVKNANNHNSSFVCDFSIALDRAYARANLIAKRLELFEALADELEGEIGLPDKLIHLNCQEKILLERILRRVENDPEKLRQTEKNITIDYLQRLTDQIEIEVARIEKEDRIKIIHINSHEFDFAHNPEDQQKAISMVLDA